MRGFHADLPDPSTPFAGLLFHGGGEHIESYLRSELLLQHGSGQPLRAKTTVLDGASFENKPEPSLAQDVYLPTVPGGIAPGRLPQPSSIFHIVTADKQHSS